MLDATYDKLETTYKRSAQDMEHSGQGIDETDPGNGEGPVPAAAAENPTPPDERHNVDYNGSPRNPGWTPLMTAAKYGQEQVVKLLCEARAEVNCRDLYGNTALNVAVREGHNRCVSEFSPPL